MTRRFVVTVDSDSCFSSFEFIDAIRNELAGDDAKVSVTEVKPSAKWIEKEYGMYYECSGCGYLIDFPTRFCKECGARMHDVEGRA